MDTRFIRAVAHHSSRLKAPGGDHHISCACVGVCVDKTQLLFKRVRLSLAGRRRRPGRQAVPVTIACELGAQHPRLQGQRQRRGVGREAQQKGPSASALRAIWLPGRQQGALRPFSHLLALVQLTTALYCIDISLILSATSHCSGGSNIIFCSQRSASSFVQSQQPKSILA